MGLKKKFTTFCCCTSRPNTVDIDEDRPNHNARRHQLGLQRSNSNISLLLTPQMWIESNYHDHLYVLRASIHQGQVISPYRGSQCTSVALYAMIHHQSHIVTSWDSATLDEIVHRGTDLHQHFREVEKVSRNPDKKIGLEDFPAEFQVNGNLRALSSDVTFGPIARASSDSYLVEGLPDLATYLINSFSAGQTSIVVTVGDYSIGILEFQGHIWLFDSHACDHKGGAAFLSGYEGKACLCGFTSCKKLINHLLSTYGNLQYDARSFTFFPVSETVTSADVPSDQSTDDVSDVEDTDVIPKVCVPTQEFSSLAAPRSSSSEHANFAD